ncbi:TonB-dependent receptor [Sphingomonas yunnanensis]|uniref:TonB-dependent receptor n=1 Tax=Sphingomonas yunnanensis TaxID=310400 RepID=UPI001CA6E622|nr:TonB-dependent receptor [Sphingomonas yunnanensis]MBY9064916.1 TonB-dependent receptor [Sphingomonas yunnanensis]
MKKLIVGGAAATIVSVGQVASAQIPQTQATTEATENSIAAPADDIVVTGFRRSLDLANETKRRADVVSDVISAEDIGQFPDLNLAESLQRITGVQITRSAGEGSGVSIRGLPQEFTRVQYNGRTLGSGGTRSFDFTAFSALFTSAVEVIKSPTSDLIEGGLSGTVNVQTARPLAIGKTTLSASVEGVYEEQRDKLTPRVAVLGNWVNAAGTFGVSAGVAYERREYRERFLNTYGAETSRESPLLDAAGRAIQGGKTPPIDYNVDGDFNDTYSFEHGYDAWNNAGSRKRLTAIFGYQFKPSDTLELYGDAFYSRFNNDTETRRAQLRITDIAPRLTGGTDYGVRASTIDTSFRDQLLGGSQGFVTALDADGISNQATARGTIATIDVLSFAQGVRWTSGALTLEAEGSYFRSKNDNRNFGLQAQGRASAAISYPDGISQGPAINFNRGYDQLDPDNFYLTVADLAAFTSRDRNWEGRLDATYQLGDEGFFRSIKVGVFASDRRFRNTAGFAVLNAQQIAALSGGSLTVTPGVEGTGGIAAGGFLTKGDFRGLPGDPGLLVIDTSKFDAIVPRQSYFDDQDVPPQAGQGFDIGERNLAAYYRVNFMNSDEKLAGNVGLRWVQTRTSSIGLIPDLDNLIVEPDRVNVTVPTAGSTEVRAKYSALLPSLNVKYSISPALLVRAAAARVIGRPDLGQLAAGTSVDANVRSISSGNPGLAPFKSDQLDLSLEYYFARGGLLSLAGFYKHLTDYIVSGQTTDVRTVTLRTGGTSTLEFRRNQPLNLLSGDVKGVEVAAQLPLSYLTPALDGFGLFGNYTYIDAPQIPRTQGGEAFPLDGVAKHNYNVGGYFEKYGLGVRGSYSYRGRYSNGGGTFGDGNFNEPYGQLDGSISYKLTQNADLSVDVTNLLDAHGRQLNSFGLLSFEGFTGRRFTGGLRIRF